MNPDIVGSDIVPENSKTLSDNRTFSEDNTDEIDAKVRLNALIESIHPLPPTEWEENHRQLNEGIVGSNASSRDCYIIGCVVILQNTAKEQNCLFAKDGNQLYVYNREYWIQTSEELVKKLLHKASEKMGIPKAYSLCVKFIKTLYEQLLESGFYEKIVQSDITYLNVKNGTLQIDSNGVNLVPHDPKHFLTHQMDFDYDKTRTNQSWLNFIDMIIPDKETQKTLQQALGYLFIRDLKLEIVIFLYGVGSNGKSVIFEVLKGLLDSNMMTNYSLVSLTNKLGYQLAGLNNKLINYGSDISMKNVDAAIFKQLASGEPIGTRQIREKSFIMTNYAKLIFNVNKLDDADIENTHGFFRRMVFIPFGVTIPKEQQDKKLHKKLLENKAGIMNWIVDGIEEVVRNEEVFLSEECEDFLENFKKESSPIQLFLEDSGLVKTQRSDNAVIDFQQVYEMYREFCKQQGESHVSQRNLSADLKRLGFERTRRKYGYVWFAQLKPSKDIS